jgi:hypothetical protein
MALNGIRSLHSLNGNEWQTLDSLAKWQMRLSLSSQRLRCHQMSLRTESPNAIQCHKIGAKNGKRKTFPTTTSTNDLRRFEQTESKWDRH